MGLSDDLPDDALTSAEENEAEQLAAAVLDATEAGEYEAAVEAVGDLLGALSRADDDAFARDKLHADPTLHIQDRFTGADIDPRDLDEPGILGLYANTREVTVWASAADDDVSAGFKLDADGALELAELLRQAAANSKAGEGWEFNQ